MSTARFLKPEECERLLVELKNPRDYLLAQLGLNTGLRISSMLGLKWGQLFQNGAPAAVLEIARGQLKGGRSIHRRRVKSRRIPLNNVVAAAVREYAFAEFGSAEPPLENFVFASRKRFLRAINRKRAHQIISEAAERAGLTSAVAPHSLRRVFARRCHQASNFDPVATQVLMGHASYLTTVIYLTPDSSELTAIYEKLNTPAPAVAAAHSHAAAVAIR